MSSLSKDDKLKRSPAYVRLNLHGQYSMTRVILTFHLICIMYMLIKNCRRYAKVSFFCVLGEYAEENFL